MASDPVGCAYEASPVYHCSCHLPLLELPKRGVTFQLHSSVVHSRNCAARHVLYQACRCAEHMPGYTKALSGTTCCSPILGKSACYFQPAPNGDGRRD